MMFRTEKKPILQEDDRITGYEEAAEALADFMARMQKAIAEYELPESPYRIRRKGDEWWCEKAVAEAYPIVAIGGVSAPRAQFKDAPEFAYMLHDRPSYSADSYRNADIPNIWLSWKAIGKHGVTGTDYAGNQIVGTLPFKTYQEAERWLHDYLTPEAETTYFKPDGSKA